MGDLGINVSDTVRTAESMGDKGAGSAEHPVFKNPTKDPRIFGVAQVGDLNALITIAPLAVETSKKEGKPVMLVVMAK